MHFPWGRPRRPLAVILALWSSDFPRIGPFGHYPRLFSLLALLILTFFYFVVKLLSGCSAISCAHGGFRPPKTRLKSVGTQCSSQSGFVPPQIPRLGASKSAQPFNRRLTILFRISSMLSHSFSSCAKSEFSPAGAGEKQLFFYGAHHTRSAGLSKLWFVISLSFICHSRCERST